jgi:hypothetical protein
MEPRTELLSVGSNPLLLYTRASILTRPGYAAPNVPIGLVMSALVREWRGAGVCAVFYATSSKTMIREDSRRHAAFLSVRVLLTS